MKIGAASGIGQDLNQALYTVIPEALRPLDGLKPDMGILLVSSVFEEDLIQAGKDVVDATGVATLVGCVGEGVIGPLGEHEREPAVALWLAHFPGVGVQSFHLTPEDIESAEDEETWRRLLKAPEGNPSAFIILGDPYSTDVNRLLGRIDESLPGVPVVGGMASSGTGPGQYTLLLDNQAHNEGVVGVCLGGALSVETVVSQGCRPIGNPFVVTRAERNVIQEMGGVKPLAAVRSIYEASSGAEQELMQKGLFVGRVINEYQDTFKPGDFLIRNLVGADEATGAIALMDIVPAGTTIQFHVRDAETADEDLRSLLASHSGNPPAGALLFSCNGRGSRLFPRPNHDVGTLTEILGSIPVAGFFCAGELGPVGARNFIHGHTASIALFRPGAHPA